MSPWPLPPCRSPSRIRRFSPFPFPDPVFVGLVAKSSTSRLCSVDESVAWRRRCRQCHALSFLGFVPLQGPSDCDRTDADRRLVQPISRWDPYCTNSAAHPALAKGRARSRATEGAGDGEPSDTWSARGKPRAVHPSRPKPCACLESGTCKQVFGPDSAVIPWAVHPEPRATRFAHPEG